ncbi:MAG: histidinol dehydrogenase, partial [Kofleriaceae bacterium]|nr:histidinol dehydrogenase [Kofleriaceae bacterium]
GQWTPEALGDYASGTNHVLPTSGAARAYSGVALESFQKQISFQRASPEALLAIEETVTCLAKAEGLGAHAASVSRRCDRLRERLTT